MSLTSSPKLTKGGLVVLDAVTGAVRRTIALQYNPETLTRSYQVQGAGGEGGGERAQPFRLKGPAIESIKLDAEIDATDALEFPGENANAVQFGIAPQLAVLESLINPSVAELQALDALSDAGTLEILPPEAPLVLFVWSASRVVPVRVTDCSITEDAFDALLNPPLGLVPPLPPQIVNLDDTAQKGPLGALMAGLAYAGQHSDSVFGQGRLDVARYGRLLKSRRLVGVRGAGLPFDGLYYVKSVSHDIKRGEYKQSFTLARNALISTVPTVPV